MINIHFGKQVVSRDGTQIGKVDHLALDPDIGKLLAIVVTSGIFLSKARLVEPAIIDLSEPDGTILLAISANQAKNLPVFIKEEHIVPERPDTLPNMLTPTGILWPEERVFPHYGQYGEDKNFVEMSPLNTPIVEVVSNLPSNATEVGHHVRVVSSDEESLGRISGIQIERHGEIVSISVRFGHLGRHHELNIPWSRIQAVTHRQVKVKLTFNQFRERVSVIS